DAGLYRDALGAVPPQGLPGAFLQPVDGALERVVGRYARSHGPFTEPELAARLGVDVAAAVSALVARGELLEGGFRPGGAGREVGGAGGGAGAAGAQDRDRPPRRRAGGRRGARPIPAGLARDRSRPARPGTAARGRRPAAGGGAAGGLDRDRHSARPHPRL